MADALVAQAIREEGDRLRAALVQARDLVQDVRGYALSLRELVAAGVVHIGSVAGPLAVQPVTFASAQPVTMALPNPLPVSGAFYPATQPVTGAVTVTGSVARTNAPAWEAWTPNAASATLTATGTIVAAQGAGVAVLLVSLVLSAVTAVTITLNTVPAMPVRLAANGSLTLPFHPKGWGKTNANTALTATFTGANTVTTYAQWVAA